MCNFQTTTSLIISTYNWPQALELCLQSCLTQTVLPNEIIIADDGSKEDTKILVEHFKTKSNVNIVHVWHEDKGFRLGSIRNKAIKIAKFDYIIQIDGDLILHKNFIQDHLLMAKPDQFVSGSRALIKKMHAEQILSAGFAVIPIPFKHLERKFYAIRSLMLCKLSIFLKNKTDLYKYVLGANMAFWKNDLMIVNGYNENIIGWGKEDNEIAVRLLNAGKKLIVARNICLVYHLYHHEASKKLIDANLKILLQTIEQNITFVENGITKSNMN